MKKIYSMQSFCEDLSPWLRMRTWHSRCIYLSNFRVLCS